MQLVGNIRRLPVLRLPSGTDTRPLGYGPAPALSAMSAWELHHQRMGGVGVMRCLLKGVWKSVGAGAGA